MLATIEEIELQSAEARRPSVRFAPEFLCTHGARWQDVNVIFPLMDVPLRLVLPCAIADMIRRHGTPCIGSGRTVAYLHPCAHGPDPVSAVPVRVS